MAGPGVNVLLRQLRAFIAGPKAEGQSDRHLLEQFLSQPDEASFAALLERHGPMVLAVCRRIVHDEHLAEDAFQATFLVLARKVGTIRNRASVGSWLHGVALRLARKAKTEALRFKRPDPRTKSQAATDPQAEASWHEAQEILDDELQRLPEKYRLPLILCYLEGLTRDEAAVQLGWTAGKLKGLLERGRDQLRSQLVRRGVTLSAAGAATLLADTVLSATVPPLLAVSTIHAAARLAMGTTLAACGISAPVVALTEGGLTMMASKKMSLILALALFSGLLGMGVRILAQQSEPVEKKHADDLPAVQVADAPLAADGPNEGAAKPPRGALASFGRLPFHNGSRIHASELSPDGKLLATLSSRSATVWNTATGQPLHRFFFDVPSWPPYRRGLAFSPDGKRLACGPTSEHIFVWDLASGKELRRFATKFEMFAYSFFRFSADSAALIVESNDLLSWLNVDTGATIRRLPHGRIKQLSPDDKTFVIVRESNQQVLIGDAVTGEIKHTLPIAARFGGTDQGVMFLADGVTLAAVHHFDNSANEVQFWNFKTGKRQERTWSLPKNDVGVWHRLALSPDRKVLYSTLRRYSLEANKELPPIPLGWTAAIFPLLDAKTLIAVGLEEIHRWDVVTGKEISNYKDFIDWRETAISPDGRWLALRGAQFHDGFLELCDTKSHQTKHIAWPWGNGATIGFTSDSRSLAVNQYYHLQFVSVPELKEGKRLTPPKEKAIDAASIAFSNDGRHVATCSSTGHLRLFDLTNDKELWSFAETSRALFTPDGKHLLAQSRKDGNLRLYDLATKKIHFEVQPPRDRSGRRGPWISAWAFDPSGRILAVAMTGGSVYLLDAATGKERSRFLSMFTDINLNDGMHYLHATALAFSPNGQWLAVGGEDGFLRIWELSTRRELHRLHGHEGATQSLGFSADGRRLVSFGDSEGFVWDLRPRKENVKGANPFVDLLAKDGPTAYRAVWTIADDPQGPAMLRAKIPPKRVDASPERIARLIADLNSEQFKTRNAAMESLAELEGSARPALVGALEKNPSLEIIRRIEKLLGELDTPTEPALQISRALQAMELNGSAAARKLLQEWSEGTPGLRLTEESRAVLARCRMGPSSGKD